MCNHDVHHIQSNWLENILVRRRFYFCIWIFDFCFCSEINKNQLWKKDECFELNQSTGQEKIRNSSEKHTLCIRMSMAYCKIGSEQKANQNSIQHNKRKYLFVHFISVFAWAKWVRAAFSFMIGQQMKGSGWLLCLQLTIEMRENRYDGTQYTLHNAECSVRTYNVPQTTDSESE